MIAIVAVAWRRLDGGNHVRRALGADRSHAGRAGERISPGLCADPAAGVEIRQLAGRRAGGTGAGGAGNRRQPGLYRRFGAGLLRLLYSADLPQRSGGDPVRPLRHHPHRPLRDQPQLYSARPDRRQRLLRLRLDPRRGVRFLMPERAPANAAIHGYRDNKKGKMPVQYEFQTQNRLSAVTTLLLIALIIRYFCSSVPGAGLEPAQP